MLDSSHDYYNHPYLFLWLIVSLIKEHFLYLGTPLMNAAIVQQAVAFVITLYGLESANISAQVDAIQEGSRLVTVWIGSDLKQSVIVTENGTVQRLAAVGGHMLNGTEQ